MYPKDEAMKNKSIIKDIFYKDCGSDKPGERYLKALKESDKLRENLKKDLTDEQIELFEKIHSLEIEIESEAALTHFNEAFKIGLLLGIEVSED